MGRFLESMGYVAAYAACFGIAMVGVGCGVESVGERAGLRFEGTEPGDCEDGADNDADGLFDCDDPGCAASPLCDGGTGGTSGTGGGAGGTSGAGGSAGTSGGGGAGGGMLCADADCDDQNQCTEDACDPIDGACGYTNVIDGLSCDFGGLPGVCNAGACEDAMLCATVDCDDQNQCTEDECDPMDGACGYTNATDGTACGFGSLPGVCTAGVCEDAMLCADVDCDDSDQCTQDVCNPMDGQCLYANATDGTACDFGGLPGVCTAGVCGDAMLCSGVDCDDDNECTQEACDPMDGQCGYADVMDGTTCDFGGLPGVCTAGTCTTEPCVTNALCDTCPTSGLCDSNDDCASGGVCVPSGCETHGGDPIKQCILSWAGSCSSDAECPNQNDYDCLTVGAGGKRCVRVASGCNPATETYDCAPGFSCESGTCVDRRMPCDSYENCPKSHICLTTPVSQYCARVSRTCHVDEDCSWIGNNFGTFCADVDGDLRKECIGERDATGTACVSSDCGSSVCETGAVGSAATCGDYGLCRFNSDCGAGFECLGLWQDGRKECVPTGGTCDQVTDCDPQQVCAAPRTGNDGPSCQAGSAP